MSQGGQQRAMRMSYLHEFVVLTNTMSYTATAKQLFLTQSTLSKHIAALEKDLGAELIEHTGSGVSLTEAGMTFRDDAVTILNDYRKATERIAALKHRRESFIRIGYLRDAALPLLAPLSEWFKRNHPGIELQFLSSDYQNLPEALDSHRVDVIITMDADAKLHDRCCSIPLYADSFVVALSQQNPLAERDSLTLYELQNETLLVPSNEIWPEIRLFVNNRCSAEMKKRFRQIEDVDTLFFMVGTGQGSAIVASHNRLVYGKTIAFRPLDEPDIPQFSVSALYLKDQQNASTDRVLEMLTPALEYAKKQL